VIDEMETEGALGGEYRVLPIEKCVPNEWNPNEMDEETLNKLSDNIDEVGFIDPIQVVRIDRGDGAEVYQILGGEHRWQACKYSGKTHIPAIVLTSDIWKDEDLKKFVTVRLNALRGEINTEKFVKLWTDLARRYEAKEMQNLLAFTDNSAYKSLTKGLVQDIVSMDLPASVKDQFKKKIKEEKLTVGGISKLLNELFSKYGSTVPNRYLFFDYGNKEHLWVPVDDRLWKHLTMLMNAVSEENVSATEVFKDMLRLYDLNRLKRLPKVISTDEQ